MYKLGIVNGTFDVLHTGHVKLLKAAKHACEKVMVCIDTDRRVHELKGQGRPVNKYETRYTMLKALRYVDSVYPFDNDEELRSLLRVHRPDVMFKGSDYINKPIIGKDLVPIIFYVEKTDESTTKFLQNISIR